MRIEGQDIYVTRGDSQFITIIHYDEDNNQLNFISGQDIIYFTVKTSAQTVQKTIQKTITNFTLDGEAVVEINPEDTKDLRFGQYVYDVQWTQSDGTIITIVKPSKFIVEYEVTYE
jgi:hypothetical protein